MKRDIEYLECSCTSAEHTLRFTFDSGYFDGDEMPVIYIDVQLNRANGFWKRLWRAIRYVCGYECRFGHWDEALLLNEGVRQLRTMCDRHLEQWERWEKSRRSTKTTGNL